MKKGANGVGSASIVLIFAVLCLTIFALITFSVADRERVLVEREAELVIGFYRADAIAEIFLADFLDENVDPDTTYIMDKTTAWCGIINAEITSFNVSITESMILAVTVAVHDRHFDILSWRIENTREWTAETGLDVWIPG